MNSGFETQGVFSTDAAFWTETLAGTGQVTRTSDEAHSGHFSLKMSGDWGWQAATQSYTNDCAGKWARLSVFRYDTYLWSYKQVTYFLSK